MRADGEIYGETGVLILFASWFQDDILCYFENQVYNTFN